METTELKPQTVWVGGPPKLGDPSKREMPAAVQKQGVIAAAEKRHKKRLDAMLDQCQLADGEVQIPKPYAEGLNRIVCAANKTAGGIVVPSARHHDTVMNEVLRKTRGPDEGRDVQGFIDRMGNFLTREEAWVVAFKAGQIIRRCGNDGRKLWSENLY